MASLSVKIQGLDRLEAYINRQKRVVDKPFSAGTGRKVASAIKASIREEFLGSYWKRPGGSRETWEKVNTAFRKGAKKPFRGLSGSLYRAWRSAAPTISGRRVEITAKHPGMAMHRGGEGLDARVRRTRVNVTPSSRFAIAKASGDRVFLKKSTSKVVVISRPHATANPQLMNQVRDIIVEKVRKT